MNGWDLWRGISLSMCSQIIRQLPSGQTWRKIVDHLFLKFRKETSLDLLLASINFFFIINSTSCCYSLGLIKTLSLSQWHAWSKETGYFFYLLSDYYFAYLYFLKICSEFNILFLCYSFSFFGSFASLTSSNFCLIYCDLKFSLYKWSKCKMMAMAGLKQSLFRNIFCL